MMNSFVDAHLCHALESRLVPAATTEVLMATWRRQSCRQQSRPQVGKHLGSPFVKWPISRRGTSVPLEGHVETCGRRALSPYSANLNRHRYQLAADARSFGRHARILPA